MKEKLLLIGSGFIGDPLAKRLTNLGFEVAVMDLKTGFDIRERRVVEKVISSFEGQHVVLMAAISDLNVFEANPELGMDVNVQGTCNVALSCSKHKKRLHYISTCCVYGNTDDFPSSELSRPEPSEVYAACKLAGEWIIKGLHRSYDLQYNILRIATCFGPGMRSALAPAVFINQILSNTPITIHGDGEQTRTYTFIEDEVEGIATVINSGHFNETFNVSTNEEVSVKDMIQIICEEMGAIEHPIIYVRDRRGQTFIEQIDSAKLKSLGWNPTTTFREGIKKTLSWMKENNMEKL